MRDLVLRIDSVARAALRKISPLRSRQDPPYLPERRCQTAVTDLTNFRR